MSTSQHYRIVWQPITLSRMLKLNRCGVLTTPTMRADEIHQGHLNALQHNARTKRLAFSGDETYKLQIADRGLEKMGSAMDSANQRTGGAFATVCVVSFSDVSRGKCGISRWVYAKTPVCHDTVLM